MFFVKTRLNANKTLITNITDQNVFTHCPDCGAEVQVNLSELVENSKLNLADTSVYCQECGNRRWGKHDADDIDDNSDDDGIDTDDDIDIPAILDHMDVSIDFLRFALRNRGKHGHQ